MPVAFTRQLGQQPGIQLNPLRDNTNGFVPDNSDQVFAIPMRCVRGRIDKPFKVNRSNAVKLLGRPGTIRASALNEAMVQVYEAVNNGAYEAVVHRLTVGGAPVLNWINVILDPGTGVTTQTIAATATGTNRLFSVQHLSCFNSGIKLKYWAERKRVSGSDAPNDRMWLQLIDPLDNEVIAEFYGSLDPAALDEFQRSAYLPDVVTRTSDDVVVLVAATTAVPVNADFYGVDSTTGQNKWVTTATQVYFTEGGTGYGTVDYALARTRLESTPIDFGFIASGGNQSSALLAQMAMLAFNTNRHLKYDISGSLTPAAAQTMQENLNFDTHYAQAFWAPLRSDDPLNGPNELIGTSAFNIARACGRNAQTNARGFAPKNFPVAGREYPLTRTGIKQIYSPTEQELSDLASAKIVPVLYERYTDGGRYVFTDSLTCAKTLASFKKLSSVAEMSASIDDMVTRYAKQILHMPMSLAIRRMSDYLTQLFEAAEASGWTVPSPELDGASFDYEVRANQQRPADRMDVRYSVRYDGAVRQITVTQTLSL